MNKKYYIKLISSNLFCENKSNKKDDRENPIIQFLNMPKDDKQVTLIIKKIKI